MNEIRGCWCKAALNSCIIVVYQEDDLVLYKIYTVLKSQRILSDWHCSGEWLTTIPELVAVL